MATDLGTPVTFSEWAAPFNGFIATCVETAGQIMAALVNGTEVTAGAVQQNAQGLFDAGQADTRGATTFSAEQGALAKQGIATDLISVTGDTSAQLAQLVQGFIGAGRPVGIGFNNATALQDTISGKRFDAGVFGHAAVIEGTDATGALVADPNTAPGTGLVHYNWDNLLAGGANDLLVTQSSARSFAPGSPTTLSSNPSSTFGGVPLPFIPSVGGDVAKAISGGINGVLGTLQADLRQLALMGLALLLLATGLLILFWEQAQAGGRAASNIAGLAEPPLKALQLAGAAKQLREKPRAQVRETKPAEVAPTAAQLEGARQQGRIEGVKGTPAAMGRKGGQRSGESRRAKREGAAVESAPDSLTATGEQGPAAYEAMKQNIAEAMKSTETNPKRGEKYRKAKENLE